MNKTTVESLREMIRSSPAGRFTAAGLQEKLGVDYETFKGFLFELLGESDPIVEQVFDLDSRSIHLQRITQ